mmetsp:Transcript_9068/g.13161  ORF Transcript_9068/g.13161 Transcript_9068/m.13161 type:complete len:102 (+) Transcript_9068:1191-1496(+)
MDRFGFRCNMNCSVLSILSLSFLDVSGLSSLYRYHFSCLCHIISKDGSYYFHSPILEELITKPSKRLQWALHLSTLKLITINKGPLLMKLKGNFEYKPRPF